MQKIGSFVVDCIGTSYAIYTIVSHLIHTFLCAVLHFVSRRFNRSFNFSLSFLSSILCSVQREKFLQQFIGQLVLFHFVFFFFLLLALVHFWSLSRSDSAAESSAYAAEKKFPNKSCKRCDFRMRRQERVKLTARAPNARVQMTLSASALDYCRFEIHFVNSFVIFFPYFFCTFFSFSRVRRYKFLFYRNSFARPNN